MAYFMARVLGACAILALAACSSTQGTATPQSAGPRTPANGAQAPLAHAGDVVQRGVPFMQARSPRGHGVRRGASGYPVGAMLLFEGDSQTNAVNVYSLKGAGKNAAPIATITDGLLCPYGMVLDGSGTLYVANNCGANAVTEYRAGSLTMSGEITNGVSDPLGLAMDKKGTLYVANYPPAITIYPKGSTSPSQTITAGLEDPFGLALDKSGDLFVADFGALQVFEIKAGTTTPVALNLQDLSEPIAVAIDKAGNLWVTDGAGDKVNVYPPGATTPSQQITTGYTFPYEISADKKGTVAVDNEAAPAGIQLYKKNTYTSYATLTNGVEVPTGLLIGKN
jgi:hypothetical protein